MSKPTNLHSKIFLDSSDPKETQIILDKIGFLDGQTTNPSLVVKNPEVQKKLALGQKFSTAELLDFYKHTVQQISKLIPRGSVSIEVYADKSSTKEDLLKQANEMYFWIPNAHIKFPTIRPGLEAASEFIQEGGKVNMTLCFNQAQAAAVYSATKGASKGDVFYSSFVGRLFDNGINGIAQLANVIKMYENSDGHVEVLAASFRNFEQFFASIALKSDIITTPFALLLEWAEKGLVLPDQNYNFTSPETKIPEFETLDLTKEWSSFDINYPLTEQGLERFASDWNNILK
jgi:transaldolase